MADLRTNYVDDILDTSTNERRKYRMITNDDGTVSFVDVTDYSQIGDSFGSNDLNAITNAVNENTSNIEQINVDLATKQTTITGGATSIVNNNLTASRALVSDANGKVAVSSITSTKLGYLSDVTSKIQAQLDGKHKALNFASTATATSSLAGDTDHIITLTQPSGWSSISVNKKCVVVLGVIPKSTNNTVLQIRSVAQDTGKVACRAVGSTTQAYEIQALWIW